MEVKMFNPSNMTTTIGLAKLVEDKLNVQHNYTKQPT